MKCNICGGTAFTDMPKRPKVRCASCGSLERTRVAALEITRRVKPAPGARILHFAPERGLSALLRGIGGAQYRAVDLDPSRYPGLPVEHFDLTRDIFDLAPGSFDLIVHNHVLEHVEANYTIVLLRLARALSDEGAMVFSIPILPGGFSDELIKAPLAEKLERFGPMLHVRRFGTDMLQQTLGMIFPVPDRYDLAARFDPADLVEANIPPHHWSAYTGASIFTVRRRDLRV